MIECRAPGKAVIWGEYAVLEGAPSLVMAVDRYARSSIRAGGDQWQVQASGFTGSQQLTVNAIRDLRSSSEGVAAVVAAGISALGDEGRSRLPDGAEVLTDTTDFYQNHIKLGIGSSAAVCTATYATLAAFLNLPATYEGALAAHHALQGKSGSGLDVAAAYHGGLIRFQARDVSHFVWPDHLHYRFLWTGHAALTTDHLARFNAWKAHSNTTTLDNLCRASERMFANPDLPDLADYTACLRKMDETANIGIYDSTHRRLDELANEAQVVYKPCGAGGGDIGVAVSDDKSALENFATVAGNMEFPTLNLEIAGYGVHRIRE
jgi:phosphomevalonate kinase